MDYKIIHVSLLVILFSQNFVVADYDESKLYDGLKTCEPSKIYDALEKDLPAYNKLKVILEQYCSRYEELLDSMQQGNACSENDKEWLDGYKRSLSFVKIYEKIQKDYFDSHSFDFDVDVDVPAVCDQSRSLIGKRNYFTGEDVLQEERDREERKLLRKPRIEVSSTLDKLGRLSAMANDVSCYHRNKQCYALKQAGVSLVPTVDRWAVKYKKNLERQANYRKRNKDAYDSKKAGEILSTDQECWAQLHEVTVFKHRLNQQKNALSKKAKT